ncbi:hypothetical protein H310_08540 [Aphanomyces invadans]|uniref:Uncharacterized protein n=1 Tax=Aphanomyces invadans TaxID=157072 RepID=A0A024TZQ3_9STRA|nr:hypothetical protein H310_08540 [Aphanomyces invadans]ETV99131.1 hypothetical protein H310_08540 [Aphanomyces invadans]|eukprot:XP_008872559.1 hypothetical protein H310_08540 [Aphanomyces invadans]
MHTRLRWGHRRRCLHNRTYDPLPTHPPPWPTCNASMRTRNAATLVHTSATAASTACASSTAAKPTRCKRCTRQNAEVSCAHKSGSSSPANSWSRRNPSCRLAPVSPTSTSQTGTSGSSRLLSQTMSTGAHCSSPSPPTRSTRLNSAPT